MWIKNKFHIERFGKTGSLKTDTIKSQSVTVGACFRQIKNRPHQFDDKAVLAPGKIRSA